MVAGTGLSPPVPDHQFGRRSRRTSLFSSVSSLDETGTTEGDLELLVPADPSDPDIPCWAQCGVSGSAKVPSAENQGKPLMNAEIAGCSAHFCPPCMKVVRSLRRDLATDKGSKKRLAALRRHNPERYKTMVRSYRMGASASEPGFFGCDVVESRRQMMSQFNTFLETTHSTSVKWDVVLLNRRAYAKWYFDNEGVDVHAANQAFDEIVTDANRVGKTLDSDHRGEIVLPVHLPKRYSAAKTTTVVGRMESSVSVLNTKEEGQALVKMQEM